MYRAKDAVENEDWLTAIQQAGRELELDPDVISTAEDMFLSSVPNEDRSKKAVAAASLYAAALVSGEERAQGRVATAMGVSRLSVQAHWKELVEKAGFEAPAW